ncbi:hypothetical protein EDB85DRAFT_1988108, partial [Lactarius pseudohatsudake]
TPHRLPLSWPSPVHGWLSSSSLSPCVTVVALVVAPSWVIVAPSRLRLSSPHRYRHHLAAVTVVASVIVICDLPYSGTC